MYKDVSLFWMDNEDLSFNIFSLLQRVLEYELETDCARPLEVEKGTREGQKEDLRVDFTGLYIKSSSLFFFK